MADRNAFAAPVTPELLTASFVPGPRLAARNRAWEQVLGAMPDPWERLAPADRELAAQLVQEALTGSLSTNQVLPVAVPGRDEPLPVLFHFIPVHQPAADDAPPGVTAVTVTGEALAEPETWTTSQTQRLRLETLGRMTMGIAHDFNNLLSSILGYTELLRTEVTDGRWDAAYDEHLRTIEQAAGDGAALVRKIQQYIRQEQRARFEPIELPALVRDCVALTRPYWHHEPRRHGISIHTRFDLKNVPPVLGAATDLREVFVNLILNAVQAMPAGGTLSFAAHLAPEGVVVSVADTGIGMSEAVRARIFEPLFTTKGEHGTGMGLAITFGIVQEHEGSIAVESQPGRGTRFVLTFPPARAETAVGVEEAATAETAHARILVVDDDPHVRSFLVKLLSLKGHLVREAASGAEALDRVTSETFDLVFTDLGMPEMNGRQLARALRNRLPAVPIVLLTGDTDAGEPGEGVDLVLSKPFKLEKLQAAIRHLLPRPRTGSGGS